MLLKSIPLIIPTFNNPTYTKNFVDQSISVGFRNIQIYDNNSTFPRMKELLVEIEEHCKVVRLSKNFGPHYILRTPKIYESLPNLFCLSDPDVEYSKSLPNNFLDTLLEISQKHKIGKVGFAMEVPKHEEFLNPYLRMDDKLWDMQEWEEQFWKNKIDVIDGNELYDASLDTHFALYNKSYFEPSDRYKAIRVAGKFTSKHLGLYKKSDVPKEEEDFYRDSSKYSYLRGRLDAESNPVIEITVLEFTKLIENNESLDRNLTKITLERDFLNQELQKVYNSRSWKLLELPRKLLKIIRKRKQV
jgi:hypothetical protein